jgi:outer membrane immunogenic protein
MAESMNKLLFAGAATLAGALVLSHGTAFADDNPEMTNLLRNSAKYNYQIVDAAGLKASETAKASKTAEDSGAAEDAAPRRRKSDGDHAAKASRTEASRRAASVSAPAVSTPFQETAYYPRSGPAGPWTGVYLGLNAGGVMGSRQNVATTGLDTYDFPGTSIGDAFASSALSSIGLGGNSGFIGGGQIGYNQQIDNFVLGVEADFQGTTANGAAGQTSGAGYDPASGVAPITVTRVQAGLVNFGTVRARAGYLVTPSLLAYVTGGFAYGQTNVRAAFFSVDTAGAVPPETGGTSYDSVHGGWTAGAGVEWMFSPGWSAKLEYLYYDLGAPPLGMTGIGFATPSGGTPVWAYLATTTPPRFSGSIVRAGVNYHLDWGIPGSILRAAD